MGVSHKQLNWIALALWIVLIGLASGDVFSATNTQRWVGESAAPGTTAPRHMVLRAIIHLIEYGVLGILAFRAFSGTRLSGLAAFALTLVLGFGVSLGDETLQAYNPHRSGSGRDVVLNAIGVGLGAAVTWPFLRRRPREEPDPA